MLYAIGDIHGEIRKLERLLDHLPLEKEDRLVFIGDYIDRGPDPKAVVDYLIDFREQHDCVFLLGNHESMFLDFLGWEAEEYFAGHAFLLNGGERTLESYGLLTEPARDPSEMSLPRSHEDFLRDLVLYHHQGGHLFVHAGIGRGLEGVSRTADAIAQFAPRDVLWDRTSFESEHGLPDVVVYGHTPAPDFAVRWNLPHSVGIDTGAVFGGPLTALRIDDRQLFQVNG